MGFFDFLKSPDINQGLQQYVDTPGALLVDVREPEEYAQGRIPGSVNVPLSCLSAIVDAASDKSTPLFVYCLSGGRSGQAVAGLSRMGYGAVTNIGGISGYHGEVERG